jgi:polysaccharide biosynthesis protein PslG
LIKLCRSLAVIFLAVVVGFALLCGSIARAPRARAATAPLGVASLATLIGGQNSNYLTDAAAHKSVHGSWIRIVVPGNVAEPSQANVYNWAPFDSALVAAATYGLKILMLITGPAPTWAQAAGSGQGAGIPPADPANFGRVSGAIATRYRSWVSSWEIWNEPNIPEFFTPVSVPKYTAMLQSAYTNIHAVQPNATVMSGGLSDSNSGIDALQFVQQLYDNGGGNYLDAVALHPYTFPYKLTEDPLAHAAVVPNTYNFMVSRGQAQKKVWITEYGQPTGTAPQAVSEQQQSAIIVDFLQRASSVFWLGPSFLFTTRDISADASDLNSNFGLYTIAWQPKAVVAALTGLNA